MRSGKQTGKGWEGEREGAADGTGMGWVVL